MKIIKSNETECNDLKEIENKMKSEYYKTKKIIYKEMEDFFFMSVLKCDRTFTQLTIDDKMIIFRNKIDTIFYPYLDKVIFDNRMKLFKIINDMWNNTRMIVNRGYTPNELLKYEKLQPLVKNTEGMDNVISFESAKKKVYPNSPCPCGSGKKYKFCCGRK